jgi:hypothetical protein
VLSENWITIDPTFFFLISEFHARLSYITKYNTTHIVFIHRKTRNKKKEQIYRKLVTKMNEQIHNLFFSLHNEWFLYTNLLQILHLFVYCIEPHNRVKFDPGDKNDRKKLLRRKLCISLSSNSCSHFYFFFKSFLLSNTIIFKLPFTFFKIPRRLLKSTPSRAPHAKHLQQTRNLPHHISCKVTSTRYILWVTKRAFLIFPLYT